ncbi:MAG TPA: glycosyl transferase, partial [Gammaproteobacteria bacterium]|nr:glycosyl transferase [Gammaproteobacteria bacterium]
MIQLVMIFLAFACSLLLTRYLTIPGTWFYILDHPNERSLHDSPTPRAGGLAIFITIALFIVFISATTDLDLSDLLWLAAGSVLVALVSFVDDYMNLSFLFRLMVQTIAAGIVIYGG